MRTAIADTLGIDQPIFAFSHCRDVVAGVSKAGGYGVLGAAWMTPDELDMSIAWIEQHVGDKPFGVDLVFPGTAADEEKSPEEYLAAIPRRHLTFVKELLDEGGLGDLSAEDRDAYMVENARKMAMTNRKSHEQFEVVLGRGSASTVVGALGVPPAWVVDKAHAQGIAVGALVGTATHAARQRDAGVDILVAQGTEAGGSVGSVASIVLWPQVVEEARGLPVLAAGGISRGSQILSAFALGCQGVWLGSLWLGTVESELTDEMRDMLFRAGTDAAVLDNIMTGKQGRMLRTKYIDGWHGPDAPDPLPWPMQSILNGYSYKRAERAHDFDYWTYAVGQVVGDMSKPTTVRREMERLLDEYVDAVTALGQVTAVA